MADIFVRRTTGFLIFLITLLSIAVVALLVMLFAVSPQTDVPSLLGADEGSEAKPVVRDPTQVATEPWEVEYRIPRTSLPVHYDLYLHPDLASGLFTGKVEIHVSVTSPMKYLVTHFKHMNITKTKLKTQVTSTDVELKKYFEYRPNQFWVLIPKKTLQIGNYTMVLDFNGTLEDRIVGFYKSVYTNSVGEKR